jgi:hypothetical protein
MENENIVKVDITAPVWRSKSGDICITDRENMPDEYLQNILNSAEYRYMKYNNRAVHYAELAGKAEIAYKKSEIFHRLIKAIKTEALRRGIHIESLAEKKPEKFEILRNSFKEEFELA